MLSQVNIMKNQLSRYDPAKDFFGGDPIRRTKADGTVLDLGFTKPRAHFNAIKAAQSKLKENLEAFKRECIDGNDGRNTGLPSEAEEYAEKEIRQPFDPHAPTFLRQFLDRTRPARDGGMLLTGKP
jgi:hypothetical protein